MSKYEMLYIINNDASEEAKQAVIDKMESIVTSNGGTVENIDKWGTKKFAYTLQDYSTEGYYVLMNFEADAAVPALLNRQVQIMDNAKRCMIIKK
ncbi:MAG TPA: 30S ribosomal protein S6 [Clostridia bacterium]|nr:30S ribosomal protein S6 [Clostridia bacterium]